jgi:hypothetical protein
MNTWRMNNAWLQHAILRVAALLAPVDRRAEWLDEWHSELWYIDPRGATLFCMGAFPDALWLRRNNLSRIKRTGVRLESPLSCLALLASLATVSILIAMTVRVPDLPPGPFPPQRASDLAGACSMMLLFSALLLPGTLRVWRAPANRHPMSWPSRLRRGLFLALKIALLQPMMLCGFIVELMMGQLGGFASLGFDAAVILALRWIIMDQQRRCPVCLRLLTAPVRIGTPSRTFLEWYGTESTCSRGHGLLHISEMSSGYSEKPQWLRLDDSWSGLFAKEAGRRT